MMRLTMCLAAAAILSPAALCAQEPVGGPTASAEHRLSDAEIEKVLDAAAKKREAQEAVVEKARPVVHGEIGFEIGTGGYRSAYGTAVVDLPDDGFAILSFDANQFGRAPHYYGRRER